MTRLHTRSLSFMLLLTATLLPTIYSGADAAEKKKAPAVQLADSPKAGHTVRFSPVGSDTEGPRPDRLYWASI